MKTPREEAHKELLYKAYYNHARHHLAPGGPPIPMEGETEWLRLKNLIKEAIPNALN